MPELLHVFSAGKMNKDFDERLVPNGEYRDALNLEITDSDGANVGTLQNMRGNIELTNKYYNPSTGAFTPWSTDYINSLTNPICIGKITDNTTEMIYWFIASGSVSAIVEYDQSKDLITPILVDTQGILKFSKDYLITGINIIEGILFFTDNQTEPKSLNINTFKALNTPDFKTHTQIYGRPFIESDITVIKKKPLNALTVIKDSSQRGGFGTGVTPAIVTYPGSVIVLGNSTLNFTYIPDPVDNPGDSSPLPSYGAYTSAAPGTYPAGLNGTVTITTSQVANFRTRDSITLSTIIVGSDLVPVEYKVRLLVTGPTYNNGELIPGNNLQCQIQSMPSNLPRGTTPYVWETLLDETSPLYNLIFPRFTYRWKYNNNNVSAFAPFTEVVFLGKEFKYVSSDGYNTGMTNNIRKLILDSIDWGSEDVSEVEILYKTSSAANVYSLAKLKRVDGLVPNYTVTNEIIGAMVDSSQLLRPYDNVPLKALAQEIVGNRLIYGNYTQQYNLSPPDIIVNPVLNNRDITTQPIGMPMPSLKSIRTYQVGICLLDAHGRETPIFTSNSAASIIEIEGASESSSIQATIPPSWDKPIWATHFKYFIKEVSSEYYNLALDRYYPSEDGNIWLSFPSSERNKLEIDNYIILKKQHDSNTPISIINRYKILAISNEVPEFVATTPVNIATGACSRGGDTPPGEGKLIFKVNGPSNTSNNNFFTGIDSSKFINITNGPLTTDEYKVVSGGPNGTVYTFTLEKPLGADAAFLDDIASDAPIYINIVEKQIKILPEFEGRFFAKINLDTLFQTSVIDPFTSSAVKYAILSSRNLDNVSSNDGPNSGGSYHAWVDNGAADDMGWPGGIPSLGKGVRPSFGSKNFSYVISGFGGSGDLATPSLANTSDMMWNYLSKLGTNLRFTGANGEVSQIYKISQTSGVFASRRGFRDAFKKQRKLSGNSRVAVGVVLNKAYAESWAPTGIQAITRVNSSNNSVLASTNPAIFETEPKPSVDLKLFYQASNAYPISEINQVKTLPWFNCYSYGNGVESNRIRDDYNAVTIDKGPVVSSTLDVPYQEEIKSGGLIFSGIFNSVSGINNLNQFLQAESITKNLNPYYGSIQALLARDTDLITFCEDKILNILANKDALYNADGNQQLVSTNNVLGQTTPYVGEFGISRNPESLASYGFRTYFTDRARGTVLRLSRDGLEPIGDKGMTTFFFDNLPVSKNLVGVFDDSKGTYTLTLDNLTPTWQKLLAKGEFDRTNPDCAEWEPAVEDLTLNTTVVFKENADGWTSRMSFIPENGVSLNSIFYTFKNGRIWRHNDSAVPYNNFYNVQYDSSVNVLINDEFASVKGFKTLNYTGSESREYVYTIAGSTRKYSIAEIQANNLMPINFTTNKGWYANYIVTDLQEGKIKEFIKKEGKYFNYIKGLSTFFNTNCDNNVSSSEFAVQGIGSASLITGDTIKTEYNVNVFANANCFQYLVAPVLEPQSFLGVEDVVGVYSIGQANQCSPNITIQLVDDNTTNGTLSAIATNGSFTFTPTPNYNGSAGSFTAIVCCNSLCSEPTVMTLHIDPVADLPYFTTVHPTLTGLGVGDCWEYPVIGIASADYASTDLIIQTPVVGLPTWMSQPQPLNNGSGDWHIPQSCVPPGQAAGAIDFTLVVEDPIGNTGEQQVTGDTLVEALLALEFIGSSTGVISTAQTWTNPDDPTEVVAQRPRNANSGHGCNRGCYRVVANKQINGGLVIGRIWNSNSGTKGTATAPGSPGGAFYNTFTVSPTGIPNSPSQDPIAWAGTPAALAQGNLDSLGNPISYMYKNSEPEWGTDPANSKQRYVTTLHMPATGVNNGQYGNRYSYLKITQADADNIVANYADPTNPSHITFTIEPDSYNSNGVINTHGTSVWFQIFKAGSTAGYAGGSEVFSNGLLTDCSDAVGSVCDPTKFPKIKIDVLTGSIIP